MLCCVYLNSDDIPDIVDQWKCGVFWPSPMKSQSELTRAELLENCSLQGRRSKTKTEESFNKL